MFIGMQPKKDARRSRRPNGNVPVIVPGGSAAQKGTKRKAKDVTNALTVFKPTTTISKADVSKINTPDASGVSACLRCKIL